MPMKTPRSIILILLACISYGAAHAEDMKIDCRLRGGSVVQLTALACGIEGGTPVIETPAPAIMPGSADKADAANQPAGDPKLAAVQKAIVDLLDKEVVYTTTLKRNPEGIERTARFDGCHLTVDEVLHIEYGNFFSDWKDFKINSTFDFRNISMDELGIWDAVNSKGGNLSKAAVYFEERKRDDGNNISISVLEQREDGYVKYRKHGPNAYLDAPPADFWIADEYGYPKDDGFGNVAKDTIRIILLVNTLDDAKKLKSLFGDMNAMCRPQPGKAD